MNKSSKTLLPSTIRALPASLRTCAVDACGAERVDEVIGSRVVRGWREACAGLFAIVEFGALLIEVETWLKKRGGFNGLQKKLGVGLKAWLAEHAPEVDYKTAMGYKYAASGLIALADKARDRPLLELMGEEPLTDAEKEAAREQVREVIATSSLRLLKAAAKAERPSRDPSDRDQGRTPLLAEGPGSIRRAAAETWDKVQRAAKTFISRKFALALKPEEAKAALETVDALRDALRVRIEETRRA